MKDKKHSRRNFYSVAWVMPHGLDFGAQGVPKGSKLFFFKQGHVAYQIDGDDQHNRMQIKFSIYGQTGDLWAGLKGQIPLNFGYRVNSMILCHTLCEF